MLGLFCFALAVLASPFKSKLRLQAENAVLRHQLIVLRRSLHGRVRFTNHAGIPEVTFRPLPFAEHRTFAKRSHVKDRKGFDMTYFGSTRVVDQASAHSLPRIFTVAGRT